MRKVRRRSKKNKLASDYKLVSTGRALNHVPNGLHACALFASPFLNSSTECHGDHPSDRQHDLCAHNNGQDILSRGYVANLSRAVVRTREFAEVTQRGSGRGPVASRERPSCGGRPVEPHAAPTHFAFAPSRPPALPPALPTSQQGVFSSSVDADYGGTLRGVASHGYIVVAIQDWVPISARRGT